MDNPQLTPAEEVLAASLKPGKVRDVCLYAYSRRSVSSTGILSIHQPLPVFAVGSLLKKKEHFANLLNNGFAESSKTSKPSERVHDMASVSEYDYDTDSDLDDDEEFDLEPPSQSPTERDDTKYQVVIIPNFAYRSIQACVFWLYTNKVAFVPLSSQGSGQRIKELHRLQALGIPACSPKSMYRLADAYGFKELQEKAESAIMGRLSAENIVDEVFSSFFCRYDTLHRRAMNILYATYSDPRVQQMMEQFALRVVNGDLPHAAPTVRALFHLQTPGPSKAPFCPASARCDSHDHAAAYSGTSSSTSPQGNSSHNMAFSIGSTSCQATPSDSRPIPVFSPVRRPVLGPSSRSRGQGSSSLHGPTNPWLRGSFLFGSTSTTEMSSASAQASSSAAPGSGRI